MVTPTVDYSLEALELEDRQRIMDFCNLIALGLYRVKQSEQRNKQNLQAPGQYLTSEGEKKKPYEVKKTG